MGRIAKSPGQLRLMKGISRS